MQNKFVIQVLLKSKIKKYVLLCEYINKCTDYICGNTERLNHNRKTDKRRFQGVAMGLGKGQGGLLLYFCFSVSYHEENQFCFKDKN